MAVIQVNWIFFEMAETFNTIERRIIMYGENQEAIRDKTITETIEKIMSAKYISNPEEAVEIESQAIHHRFSSIYPRLEAYSSIILTYSAIEYWLDRLCERIKNDRNLPVGLNDFNGTLTERFIKFSKTFSLPGMENNSKSHLEKVRLIRNCIVHADGRINEMQSKKKLRRTISNEKGMALNENGALIIELDKTIELIDFAGKSIASIYESWNLGASVKVHD